MLRAVLSSKKNQEIKHERVENGKKMLEEREAQKTIEARVSICSDSTAVWVGVSTKTK